MARSADKAARRRATLGGRLTRWALLARRRALGRRLTVVLLALAILAGIATYATLTGSMGAGGVSPRSVLILLYIDIALLLLLAAVVAGRLVGVWVARRRGSAGSQLHVRLVALFALVTALPAMLVAGFSVIFLDYGIDAWFSARVRTAVNEAAEVAAGYLHEHQQTIRGDVEAMANDIGRQLPQLMAGPDRFGRFVATQAALRSLPEAIVFDGGGRILARSGLSFTLEFDKVPVAALEQAREGEVALLTNPQEDRVRALMRIPGTVDTYLYVGRFISPVVLSHLEKTQGAVAEYRALEGSRSRLQITFALIFAVVAMLLLLAAMGGGLLIANQLARPISTLITAAERVRRGDLTTRVAVDPAGGEIQTLGRAFNRMTSQLETQHESLIEINRREEARRAFTEAVLAGVTAGVIGLDADGAVTLPNRSAATLLDLDDSEMTGRRLADLVPEMAELVSGADDGQVLERQIHLVRAGQPRTLLVRVMAEHGEGGTLIGRVVTFDDISELLSAQRKAAWSGVARRIAHEIKNPLTPIQLSAERLKKRYLKQITEDPRTFEVCIDTIVRQVDDLRRMVDEFSAFARMPAPRMEDADLVKVVRQALFLQRQAHGDITFDVTVPEGPAPLRCDPRLIHQALTNLLQNAADALEGRQTPSGQIAVTLDRRADGGWRITVADNGPGLPPDKIESLTEPYVTTRARGTGLGLAIVKKIMEDHGGGLRLANRPGDGAGIAGAEVCLEFPPAAARTQSGVQDHGA